MQILNATDSTAGEIQIWIARLDSPSNGDSDRFLTVLSEDELAKANRFRSAVDFSISVATRGILRIILGNYIGLPARDLQFRYGECGKPYLRDCEQTSSVEFNVSHSSDLLLVGIARGRRIGVDVERIRSNANWRAIAKRFYSANESAHLHTLPEEAASEAFLRMWTAKEAFLKATGQGITIPLDTVEIDFPEGCRGARILNIAGDTGEASRWRLNEIATLPGYVAAVVHEV